MIKNKASAYFLGAACSTEHTTALKQSRDRAAGKVVSLDNCKREETVFVIIPNCLDLGDGVWAGPPGAATRLG